MVSQVTSSPQNPSVANETYDLTLVWNYNIGGAIIFARFANVTGGGIDRIARIVSGSVIVETKYKDRFHANISESQAWLNILRVQRSDEGIYQFDLSPTSGDSISKKVELIVHCKCLVWFLIQI